MKSLATRLSATYLESPPPSLMVHTSKIMNKLPFVTKGNLNFLPLVVRQMRKYYSITAKMFCVDTHPIVTTTKAIMRALTMGIL